MRLAKMNSIHLQDELIYRQIILRRIDMRLYKKNNEVIFISHLHYTNFENIDR